MTVSSTRHQDGNRKKNARRGSGGSRNRFESSALPPILFHLPNLSEEAAETSEPTEETQAETTAHPEMGATEAPQEDAAVEPAAPEITEIMVDSGTTTPGPSLLEQLGTHAVVFGLLAAVVTCAFLYGQQGKKDSSTDTLAEADVSTMETASIEETTASAAQLSLTDIKTPEIAFQQPQLHQPEFAQNDTIQQDFAPAEPDAAMIAVTEPVVPEVHEPVAELNTQPETPDSTELLADVDVDAAPTQADATEPSTESEPLQLEAPADSLVAKETTPAQADDVTSAPPSDVTFNEPADAVATPTLSEPVATLQPEPVATLQPPQTEATPLTGPSLQPTANEMSLENNLDALAEQVDQLKKVSEPTAKVASSSMEPKITPASSRKDAIDHMAQGQITIPDEPASVESIQPETPVAEGATEIKNYYSRTPRAIQDWTRYLPTQTR